MFIAGALTTTWLALTPLMASAPECRLDPRCPAEGKCTALGDACVIGSAADCLASAACQDSGRCVYDPSRQACDFPIGVGGDCADTPACRQLGLCRFEASEYGRTCRPTEASCEASFGCKMFGHCVEGDGYGCAGARFGACERGRACRLAGLCTAVDHMPCYATPQLCARAPLCKRAGRCTTEPFSAHVPTPPCSPTPEGCRASEACKLFGRCDLVAGRCAVTSCVDAEVCKRDGACTLVDGRCATSDPGTCQLEEVTGLVASASSSQKAWREYTFDAKNLVDRDLGTSWQAEKKKSDGSRLVIKLPESRVIAAVHIANGFQRRDGLGDLQAQNGMIGHARVIVGDGAAALTREVFELRFEREPQRAYFGWDVLKVPATVGTEVAIEVLSVSPGLLFDDLAVSEVRVFALAKDAQADPASPCRPQKSP
jgi:hypothetical protein